MSFLTELSAFLALPRTGWVIWGAALVRSLWLIRVDEHPGRLLATLAGGAASLGLAWAIPAWGPPVATLTGLVFLLLVNRIWVRWRLARAVTAVNATAEVPLLSAVALSPREHGRGIAVAYEDLPQRWIALSYDMCRLPRSVLYFVVAHEVAHHALGHFARSAADKTWQLFTTVAGGVVGFMLGGPLGALVGAGATSLPTQVVRIRWTKAQEHESDAWAALWCLEHGIDPRRGAAFLLRHAPDEELGLFERLRDTLWGTHPPSSERYRRVEQLVRTYREQGLEAAIDWLIDH